MKAQTRIKNAVTIERNADCDYRRIVENVPMTPKRPVVTWHPGLGWYVDGRREKGNSVEIADRYLERAEAFKAAIRDFWAQPSKVAAVVSQRESAAKPGERSGASPERLGGAERKP